MIRFLCSYKSAFARRKKFILMCLGTAMFFGCVQDYGFSSSKTLLVVDNENNKEKIAYYIVPAAKAQSFGCNKFIGISSTDAEFSSFIQEMGNIRQTSDVPIKVLDGEVSIVYKCGNIYYREYIDLQRNEMSRYIINCRKDIRSASSFKC